jgi:hypothetical protein
MKVLRYLFILCAISSFISLSAQTESSVNNAVLKEVQVSRDWRDVDISWSLQNGEYQIRSFIVERSKDGAHFQKIGQIDHPVISSEKFQLTDYNAKGTFCYYRIRVVESNGQEQVSKPLFTQFFNNPTLSMLSVTPNPTDNNIQLNLQMKENAYVHVRILDNLGAELLHKKMKIFSGNSLQTLEGTSELTPGNYQLEININQKEVFKISLVKA